MIHYKYWIALAETKNIGPAALKNIYDTLEAAHLSITDLFALTKDELRNEFTFPDKTMNAITEAQSTLESTEEDYLNLVEAGISCVMFFEETYPARLKNALGTAAPPVLYYLGDLSMLSGDTAAILGESSISPKGNTIAHQTAQSFASHRIVSIAGFSKGAGITTHRSSLFYGGKTVAVLPYGMFKISMPPLLQEVYHPDNMLLISAQYPTSEFTVYSATSRNRIIAALAKAMYIVECPSESILLDAAKSAQTLHIPLYTTQYAEYPESAASNPILINQFGALPICGRKDENGTVTPHLDAIIGDIKFGKS